MQRTVLIKLRIALLLVPQKEIRSQLLDIHLLKFMPVDEPTRCDDDIVLLRHQIMRRVKIIIAMIQRILQQQPLEIAEPWIEHFIFQALKIRMLDKAAVIADHTLCFTLFIDPFQQVDTVGMKSRSAMARMCFDDHMTAFLHTFHVSLRTDLNDHTVAPLLQLQLFLFADQREDRIDRLDLFLAEIRCP